jgi:hypothetical protein
VQLAQERTHAVRERFLRPEHRHLLQVADEPEALLELLLSQPPAAGIPKWITEADR